MFPDFYRMIDELHAALVGVWKPVQVHGVRAQWREIELGYEIVILNESPYDVSASIKVIG